VASRGRADRHRLEIVESAAHIDTNAEVFPFVEPLMPRAHEAFDQLVSWAETAPITQRPKYGSGFAFVAEMELLATLSRLVECPDNRGFTFREPSTMSCPAASTGGRSTSMPMIAADLSRN
jgi:hypothetical protein